MNVRLKGGGARREGRRGSDPRLERLLEREAAAEILELLTPSEMVVVLLRLEGMSEREIGAFLGVGRGAVRQRLIRAQARIEQRIPGLAGTLKGRR